VKFGEKKIKIGELLVEEGVLSQDQLQRALLEQKMSGRLLGEMLVEQGVLTAATLAQTQDLRHSTRFSYWRCPKGHGRFTPFVQFLREKDFIRPLTHAEIERLKAHIRTIRCSGCGAPVDLAREMVCGFCRSPVEALDPAAVATTLDTLDKAEARRQRVDVDALADAIIEAHRTPRSATPTIPAFASGDLISAGVALFIDALRD